MRYKFITMSAHSFDNKRRAIGAILGPAVAIFLWFYPIEGLTPVSHNLLAEFTSHTAAVNLIGTAVSLGFSPIPVAVGIALASSLGFMMPVSTPLNAIVYASGYVPITKMIKSGFIIDLIGLFCITIPIVLIIVKAVMGV